MELPINAVNEERLSVKEIGDSCKVDFIVTVPPARDTDGPTACVSGGCPDEVKQENLAVVKQESGNVCWIIYVYSFYYSAKG